MLTYKFKEEYEKQRPFKIYTYQDGARTVFDSEKHSARVAQMFPKYFEWVEKDSVQVLEVAPSGTIIEETIEEPTNTMPDFPEEPIDNVLTLEGEVEEEPKTRKKKKNDRK